MSLRGQMQINCTSGPLRKTGNFSAQSRTANTHSLQKKGQRSVENFEKYLIESFFSPSQKEVWDHTSLCSSKVSYRQPLLLEDVSGPSNSSGVRGQTTENETPSKSWFCLRDGNWTLNMPAVKRPMDDQSWPTNHNRGWEVKLLC